MLKIGNFNDLEVKRLSQIGAYLSSEIGDILLPKKYLTQEVRPGNRLTVFVYLDSEDRPVATTLAPRAQVGDFALLKVKDISPVGAFLDWGLEKDLLVPFSEQLRPMQKGEKHLVRVYLDSSERIAASAKIGKFLESRTGSLKPGQEVALTIYEFTDLGAKVIIDGRFAGLLFKSELFGSHTIGENLTGFIAKVRDDGKIDVTLRKSTPQEGDRARESFLAVLENNSGFLPIGDKSPPQEIAHLLQMSKKTFKKIIGNLYKEGVIEIAEEGIRLLEAGRQVHAAPAEKKAGVVSGAREGRRTAPSSAPSGRLLPGGERKVRSSLKRKGAPPPRKKT